MIFGFFEIAQIVPLIVSSLFLIASIIIYNKSKLSITLLFIGTLGLGYFIANLDPFLILWDEQYHALVAKNLVINPLKPTLFPEPLLTFSYKNWTENHIWLHKQPLFLWQMALSIKLFGLNEIAVRIPSILMHAILPIFIYRIGFIVLNKRTAFFGALFFATAYFPLELVAGRYSTDHNDIAFLFYLIGSFWSWFEYKNSKKYYWLILTGLFSGGAVLNKWLMGLLIYIVWIVSKFIGDSKNRFFIKSYFPIIYTGILSLVVFIPWQIYTRINFPKESSYEASLNIKHFSEPIEGHYGNLWFYFTNGFNTLYGSGVIMPFVLLFGIVFMIYKIRNKEYKIGIITTIIVVYSVFTLAETKMIAFPLIITPFTYLGIGALLDSLLSITKKKVSIPIVTTILSILIPLSISYAALNLKRIQNYHTMRNPYDNHNRVRELIEMKFIDSLIEMKLDQDYVIFNSCITVNGNIPIMFYTNHTAYSFIPSVSQIREIKNVGKKVAVINLGNLPKYILYDKDIKILHLKKERMKFSFS
ncbi:MAG: glycosyltransferase family 39 protein [Flavobacteriales bacterium]|nr:glycosyltransferase family 39 protein [Flavobacteriales bacterium]